jgi:hypothetical protein
MRHNLSYLAGIIDGEGHFALVRCKNGQGRPYLRPMIVVTQKTRPMLDFIAENYGGRVYYTKPRLNRGAMRQWYIWTLTGKKAIALARELEPLLIVKNEQVKRLTDLKFDVHGFIIPPQ